MPVASPLFRQPHAADAAATRRSRADAFDALTGACGHALLLERDARRLRRRAAELTARGAPPEHVASVATDADRIEGEVATLRANLRTLYERLHAAGRVRGSGSGALAR